MSTGLRLAPTPVVGKSSRWLPRTRRWLVLYALMLPTLLSMGVFGYYPKLDVILKSAYRWTPGQVQEYVGAGNFLDAFSDPLFWQSFRVVMIMLVANLVKMWPGIIVAIALHRIASDRWRYRYQVMFVVPMVIPGMVWLLIWKSFYDPDFGILNRLLDVSGAMSVLAWLDGTDPDPGVMPRIATALRPVIDQAVTPAFGGVWALLVPGAVWLTLAGGSRESSRRWWGYGALVALVGAAPWMAGLALTGLPAALGMLSVLIGGLVVLSRTLGPGWIIWPFWVMLTLWASADVAWWRGAALLGGAVVVGELALRALPRLTGPDLLRWAGLSLVTVASLLVLFGLIWTEPTNQFVGGRPAWLGNQDLVLPAVIFWGFPWVGTIGVLIYLAGLQQISQDVYEAAELDGVGPVGKLFKIELPLIMTQVRINLIFMTIGTLTGYEMFLILLGDDGGPGNVGLVPGLYMYKSAFIDQRYGYACALGMVMFVIILLLTIVYQKYVKVEK